MKLFSPAMVVILSAASPADAASWSHLRDPAGQYSIDLPTSSFSTEASNQAGHTTLREVGGGAVIDVYSGRNLKHLLPAQFIAQLSDAPRIQDITYSAQGRTWFAISGHYARDGSDDGGLIYYAKFVFDDDLKRFAAFEISYPSDEKRRMDSIVTHLEKSLRLVR